MNTTTDYHKQAVERVENEDEIDALRRAEQLSEQMIKCVQPQN